MRPRLRPERFQLHRSTSFRLGFPLALMALLVLALSSSQTVRPVAALSSGVVISQVYGGGGNTSAPYLNDFVELFNRGTTAVNVANWSVQYNSSTGASDYQVVVQTLKRS